MMSAIAMLLAGGVGSRLNVLVRHRAKPAVPFAGMYRIIDFTLSNIANSGINRVAVLTQYKPLSLMDHIGDGSSWDLSGRSRGVKILPPKTGEKEWDWYRGTADAVRQNLSFLTSTDKEMVLVLSGDHVYYMDYRPMMEFHRDHDAHVTIGMIPVPWEDTPQFGTAIMDEEQKIVEWEEKSPKAKSNLASMGIYVFDIHYLVSTLTTTREADFGHHIIPRAIAEAKVYGYRFDGYWRDAGTIQAYWDANMDLLDPDSGINPEVWGTMTNLTNDGLSYDRPPARVVTGGKIVRSIISPGCEVAGTVKNSVLSPGVIVKRNAVIEDSVIMHDCVIGERALVKRCILDKSVKVGADVRIGYGEITGSNVRFPEHLSSGISVVGKEAVIPDRTSIGTNSIVYPRVRESDFAKRRFHCGETIGAVEGDEA
jgi:glucose-1-phosphate adenylyltransferase